MKFYFWREEGLLIIRFVYFFQLMYCVSSLYKINLYYLFVYMLDCCHWWSWPINTCPVLWILLCKGRHVALKSASPQVFFCFLCHYTILGFQKLNYARCALNFWTQLLQMDSCLALIVLWLSPDLSLWRSEFESRQSYFKTLRFKNFCENLLS